MTEIQQQSLYGKCSWRADYGRKVKVVEVNLARRASGQVWQIDEELVVEQSCASGGDRRSSEFCRLVRSPKKWMLFRRSEKINLLETFGPQDDFGRSGISPLHPIKQSVLNKGL